MKKSFLSFGRFLCIAATFTAISSLLNVQDAIGASERFFSANGTTQGGAGTWDTTTVNRWGATAGGPYTGTAWVNANVDSATFGGTAGSISLGNNVTVNKITTTIGGFTFAAGNTITFSGSGAGVFTNSSGTTTLSGVYTGTSLTKTGVGRLELNASTNTIGKYIFAGGYTGIAAGNRLGSGGASTTDYLTFDGGGLGTENAATQDLGSTRGVTILAGGAFLGSSAAANPVLISGQITGSAGGDVTVTTGGPFVATFLSGGNWILSNTGNNWNGNAVVSGGTMSVGASGVIPDTALVNVSAGTFAVGTFTETVRGLSGSGGTASISTGQLLLANTGTTIATQDTSGTNVTIAAGGKLIKGGAGIQTLSGSTTNNGEIVINTGTFGVGGANALGSAGNTGVVTINGGKLGTNSAATRAVNASIAVNLSGDFTVDNTVFATPGALTINGAETIKNSNRTITVNNATLVLGGAVGQDVSGRGLSKSGNGVLALTNAANTYSGISSVSAGRLQVDGDGSFGTGVAAINLLGGALDASASRTVATPNPVSVQANAAITTTSAATTAKFEFSGNISGDGASTLTFRNDGADGAGDTFHPILSGNIGTTFSNPIALDNGSFVGGLTSLDLQNATGTQTFSGIISGGGGIARGVIGSDSGETVFSAANTYGGGTSIARSTLTVTNTSGSGTGTNTVTVGLNNSGVTAGFGGTLNVGNGGADGSVSGDIAFGNSAPTAGPLSAVNFNYDNTNVHTYAGAITGTNGVVNKLGTGKLILTSNASTYNGGTFVTGGTLQVDGNGSTGTGLVTVNGGTLGGNGTITGPVTLLSGTLNAGASIGAINTGALTLTTGNYDFEFSGGGGTVLNNAVAIGADVWNVAGTLTIMNAVNLVGTNFGTVALGPATRFTVFSYTTAATPTGTNFRFANAPTDDAVITLDGVQFIINYDDTAPGSYGGTPGAGGYVTLTTLSAVPEASSVLVMGLGGVFAIGAVWLGKRMGITVLLS